MRQSIFSYVLSSFLIAIVVTGKAQNNPPDSTRGIHLPTGIRLGTDLILIGTSAFSESFSGWEINGDIDFGRYYLAADFGNWEREQSLVNGLYKNDGRYYRVGIDVNFLLKDPDRNMLFFGFRYGHSNYNEQVTYSFSAVDFGDYLADEANSNARANWGELVTGLRVKVWKEFWMGYTARMKLLARTKNNDFETYEIPGYGLTFKNVYWGFNYQVFWRIPFKKVD